MTYADYLLGAIKNIDSMLEKDKAASKMFGDRKHPYASSYQPEINVSPLLDTILIQSYRHLIGILR